MVKLTVRRQGWVGTRGSPGRLRAAKTNCTSLAGTPRSGRFLPSGYRHRTCEDGCLMASPAAFQVNAPHVIFEHIEGELVMIHMAKCSYYSTDTLGVRLWDLIVAGHRVDEMREWVGASYHRDSDEIARGVQAFLAELQAEDL